MVAAYDSLEHARQQLAGTVNLFDGQPIYIEDITQMGNTFYAHITALPRMRDPMTIQLFDERLDTRSISQMLGYVNVNNNAVFVSRRPARQTKQGLSSGNVSTARRGHVNLITFNTLIASAGFVDSINNVYPSFDDCCKVLSDNETIQSMAFSRTMALRREDLGFYVLMYRGDDVAFGDEKGLKLPSKFEYLKPALDKVGIQYA